jgi:hypothetical protein
MFSFWRNISRLTDLSDFPLKRFRFRLSLDRLLLGVDNIRYDVHLSPIFYKAVTRIVPQMIARHFQTEHIFSIEKPALWTKRLNEFNRLYQQMMLDAVNKAKLRNEPQIDYLAQMAVLRLLRDEILTQFETMTARIKNVIRKYEISDHQDIGEAVKTKEALTNVLQNKDSILRNVGLELFQHLAEVQKKDIKAIREANFGAEFLLPDNVLHNPILLAENPYNDFFLIKEYDVLFGRRLEDPDKYDNLIDLVKRLISDILRNDPEGKQVSAPQDEGNARRDDAIKIGQEAHERNINELIKQIDNIEILCNYFNTKNQLKKLKKQKGSQQDCDLLKKRIKEQKKLLNFFFWNFDKAKVIDRINALYETQSIYADYCPPLVPQQIIQYLVSPRSRKTVVGRLKRLKKFQGRAYSLKPLRQSIKRLEKLTYKAQKTYLLRFLNGLARYHRDIEVFNTLKEAMDRINLVTDEKILNLSRENNTLYEFLLAHEQAQEERPIINHVIIKADLRGSTNITHHMLERGLNPASYFSLNFFDPITEVLADYDAVKVFIEGDAIILSIFEREETPGGWYSVARACGIALNILMIIQRYNAVNQKNHLPILELGIGICHHGASPTFLFDGGNRIMISSAINLADRLSSCSKIARRLMAANRNLSNLCVFQSEPDEAIEAAVDDLFIRYNVNGIELNREGFVKLTKEIKLKGIDFDSPEFQDQGIKFYTGKFPTVTGKYQRLIIRESPIPEVDPATLAIRRLTDRKYYEVCSHPRLYKLAKEDG